MNEEKQTQDLDEEKMTAEQQADTTAAADKATAEKPSQETPDNATEKQTAEENGKTEGGEKTEEKAPVDPLVEAQAKIAELEDRYLRCRAEFDNYRKRMAREYNDIRDQTRRQTIADFLTVYDYFSMGMSAISQAPDVAILKQGMEMIWNEFQKVLDGFGVKEVESIGKPFDANLHEAVSQEASDSVPEGVVLRQYKAAFKIGDKLLRPAVVVVSSGAAKAAEPVDAAEATEATDVSDASDTPEEK